MPDLSFSLLFAGAPAPTDVVGAVQAIEVDRSVEVASVFQLQLGITQSAVGDWTILERDYFRPLAPVTVRVANQLGVPEALINGFVSRTRIRYSEDPSQSVLEVTGMDATLQMNLQEKVMAWPNMPDHAIASAIFPQYALVPQVQTTSPQLVEPEGTTTQRGTDIRFLRRLARRNGFHCYVQPEPLTGLDQGFFQPPSIVPGVADAVINVSLGLDSNVREFSVDYDMTRPTAVVSAGLDIRTKAPQPGLAPASTRLPMGAEPSLTRVIPPPSIRPVGTGLMSAGELQTAAQAVADESSMALVAQGTVDDAVGILRPGGSVNVRGVGRLFNGSYYVTRVSHQISRDEGHVQRFTASRNAVTMTGAEVYAAP